MGKPFLPWRATNARITAKDGEFIALERIWLNWSKGKRTHLLIQLATILSHTLTGRLMQKLYPGCTYYVYLSSITDIFFYVNIWPLNSNVFSILLIFVYWHEHETSIMARSMSFLRLMKKLDLQSIGSNLDLQDD